MTLAALAACLVAVGALLASALLRPPQWSEEVPIKWRRLSLLTAGFSLALSFCATTLESSPSVFHHCLYSYNVAILSFVLVQGAITDYFARKVDRKILFLSNFMAFVPNALYVYKEGNEVMANFFALLCLLGVALIFTPRIMGPSDGRAFLLIAVVGVPILGLVGFLSALQGMAVLFLVYCGIAALITLLRKESKGAKIALLSKISIPAVPLIIAPFLVAYLLILL